MLLFFTLLLLVTGSSDALKFFPKTTEDLVVTLSENCGEADQIDVSKIFDMSYIFSPDDSNQAKKNRDFETVPTCLNPTGIDKWEVTHVTRFNSMFRNNDQFTGSSLGSWIVTGATSMTGMFKNSDMNPSLKDWTWPKTAPQGGKNMFQSSTFNQDLTNLDVTWSEAFVSADNFNCDFLPEDVKKVKEKNNACIVTTETPTSPPNTDAPVTPTELTEPPSTDAPSDGEIDPLVFVFSGLSAATSAGLIIWRCLQ